MRWQVPIFCSLIFFSTCGSSSVPALGSDAGGKEDACRVFARSFYEWYAPMAIQAKQGSALDRALSDKKENFDPELWRKLKEDLQAQAKSLEIVGLDFDPVLNAQDPADGYVVGNVQVKGETCLVEVFGLVSGKKSTKADVVAEIGIKNAGPRFVNFHYGTNTDAHDDLLSILNRLRAKRGGTLSARNVTFPKPTVSELPAYPERARTARVAGTVKLWFTVGQDGVVTNVGVISGNPLLRDAAVNVVKSWRFHPRALRPDMRYETEFVYVLDVQQSEGEPNLKVSLTDFRRVEVTTELYVKAIE